MHLLWRRTGDNVQRLMGAEASVEGLTEQLAPSLSSSRALSRRGESLQLAGARALLAFHGRET